MRLSPIALSLALGLATLSSQPVVAAPARPAALSPERTNTQVDADRRIRQDAALDTIILNSTALYDALVGELYYQRHEPGKSYAYLMEAARRSGDTRLYARAAEVAIQARSPDAALRAVQAWQKLKPSDSEASNYQLQILLLLGRIEESAGPLAQALNNAPPERRLKLIHATPVLYGEIHNQELVLRTVEPVLQTWAEQPATAFVTNISLARMQLTARRYAQAMDSLEKARAAQVPAERLGTVLPNHELPALVALDVMRLSRTTTPYAASHAEEFVRQAVRQADVSQELRISYAKVLIESRRYDDSLTQLKELLRKHPGYAMGWLLQGGVQLQTRQYKAAESSLQRYLTLRRVDDSIQPHGEPPSLLGMASAGSDVQAYLMLAEIADQRNDAAAAANWLKRIQSPAARNAAILQRAEALNNQGKPEQALQLVNALPGDSVKERSLKALMQGQILETADKLAPAEKVLGTALAEDADNAELLYARGMIRERLGNRAGAEADLRKVITLSPDTPAAYNALGYSLVERGERLEEARTLIARALELMPNSGAVQDSMGWAEYKLGRLKEARRWLEKAFDNEPNAEIAAHLGEVLWNLGDQTKARAIWQEGLKLDAKDKVLLRTMQEFGVKPAP